MGTDIVVYRARIGLFGATRSQVGLAIGNNNGTMAVEMCFFGMVLAVLLLVGGIESSLTLALAHSWKVRLTSCWLT
jgi:hypothetical protein